MSATDVAAKYGTDALVRLLLAVAVYLLLRALRWPVLLTVRVLNIAMHRVDLYLTAGNALGAAAAPPTPGDNPHEPRP